MALWDKMKNTGLKAKLKGEIALLQREAKVRKQTFGVQLYDLLAAEKANFVIKTPGVFAKNEQQIKGPFQTCKADIEQMMMEKNAHLSSIDIIQAKRERSMPAFTAKEKMAQAGKWVGDAGNEGKLRTQILMLEHKMKSRKEAFGMEVFDKLEEPPISNGMKDGMKNAMASQLSRFSEREKMIEHCIDQAQRDVAVTMREIRFKEDELSQLA